VNGCVFIEVIFRRRPSVDHRHLAVAGRDMGRELD